MNDIPLILLGAGASCPAGVPAAFDMAKRMHQSLVTGEHYSAPYKPKLLPALELILGRLEAANSNKVDVERVIDTARMLASRETSELAPFVKEWLDDVKKTDIDSSAFKGLYETYLPGALVYLTWITDVSRVKYLQPLVELGHTGCVTMATLNYDNTVELAAREASVPCQTGIEVWSSTGQLPAVRHGIELLKLHGSVDWRFNIVSDENNPRLGSVAYKKLDVLLDDDATVLVPNRYCGIGTMAGLIPKYGSGVHAGQLAVVFGGGNKLRADGPFLDLLLRFKAALNEREHLVVIGYAFRDPHINHIVLNWLKGSATRRMTVVERDEPSAEWRSKCLREELGENLYRQVQEVNPQGAEKAIETLFRPGT
jgi:SIR2-like domain